MPSRSPHYPLFLDLHGRLAVVVGGGAVAERKIESLVRHGARVVAVAPEASQAIRDLAGRGDIEWRARPFVPQDLEGALMAFASTDDSTVNAMVAGACRSRGILVNVADDPGLCDFLVPAIVDSGSIRLAVSTGGRSPALARRLRADLEARIGPAYGQLNDLLGALREPAILSPALPADDDRRRFFESILDSGILELLQQGRREAALNLVRRLCQAAGVEVGELRIEN